MGSYKWVISPLIWLISIVTLIRTPFITTHLKETTGGEFRVYRASIRLLQGI